MELRPALFSEENHKYAPNEKPREAEPVRGVFNRLVLVRGFVAASYRYSGEFGARPSLFNGYE